MNTIAGIRIPDGALATAGAGLAVDEELAYVAAVLHDLGLTDRHGGERRFEVDGAEAARAWALSRGMSADDTQRVWDAIALHTSSGIAQHRSPECALVHWGAGIDVLGLGADRLPPAVIVEVNGAFPRDGFADGLADLLEAAARRSPAAYALTWLAETVNRCCGTSLPAFDSFIRRDPIATQAA